MNDKLSQVEGKKIYEPPHVTRISLRPEEAVLGHCKILGGGGGFMGVCSSPTPCVNFGS